MKLAHVSLAFVITVATLLRAGSAQAAFSYTPGTPILYVSDRNGDHAPDAFHAVTGAHLGTFDAPGGTINTTTAMEIGPDLRIYMVQQDSRNVWRYNLDGSAPTEIVPTGANGFGFGNGLTFDADGTIYVSYSSGSNDGGGTVGIKKYNGTTYAYMGDFLPAASLGLPFGIQWGPHGYLYVADRSSSLIRVFDANGTQIITYSVPAPATLEFAPNGNLYVGAFSSQELRRFNSTGNPLDPLSGGITITNINVVNAVGQMSFLDDQAMFIPIGATGFGETNVLRYVDEVLNPTGPFATKPSPFGTTFASVVFVPEPSTIALLSVGSLLMLRRRRR